MAELIQTIGIKESCFLIMQLGFAAFCLFLLFLIVYILKTLFQERAISLQNCVEHVNALKTLTSAITEHNINAVKYHEMYHDAFIRNAAEHNKHIDLMNELILTVRQLLPMMKDYIETIGKIRVELGHLQKEAV